MKLSLKQNLLKYLQENAGVFASGDLQRQVWFNRDGTQAVPRTVVRRLQELTREGKIHCEEKKGHAHYSADPIPPPRKQQVEYLPNGSVRVSYV